MTRLSFEADKRGREEKRGKSTVPRRRRNDETRNGKKDKRNLPRPFYFGVSFSEQSPRRLAASGPQWRKGMEENSGDGRVAQLDGGGFSDVNPPSRTLSTRLTLGFRLRMKDE